MVAEYAKDKGQQNLAEDLLDFEIELQDLRRTFVEKLFAIHAAYAKDLANNRMRHYYDLSRLCCLSEIQSYVGTSAYQACVGDVKRICRESFPIRRLPEGDSTIILTVPLFADLLRGSTLFFCNGPDILLPHVRLTRSPNSSSRFEIYSHDSLNHRLSQRNTSKGSLCVCANWSALIACSLVIGSSA